MWDATLSASPLSIMADTSSKLNRSCGVAKIMEVSVAVDIISCVPGILHVCLLVVLFDPRTLLFLDDRPHCFTCMLPASCRRELRSGFLSTLFLSVARRLHVSDFSCPRAFFILPQVLLASVFPAQILCLHLKATRRVTSPVSFTRQTPTTFVFALFRPSSYVVTYESCIVVCFLSRHASTMVSLRLQPYPRIHLSASTSTSDADTEGNGNTDPRDPLPCISPSEVPPSHVRGLV